MDELVKPNKKYPHLFAILRYDSFQDAACPIDQRITVKKIVTTAEHAESEVVRLNQLNADKGAIYFYQITRLDDETKTTSSNTAQIAESVPA
jgi:hypothetical protein